MAAGYREIFLSFGHADHTIPLTLLFRFLGETIGLSEWSGCAALPLLFASATIVILPWVHATVLEREVAVLFGALDRDPSPLLIHFTRYVRPYALTVPLGFGPPWSACGAGGNEGGRELAVDVRAGCPYCVPGCIR